MHIYIHIYTHAYNECKVVFSKGLRIHFEMKIIKSLRLSTWRMQNRWFHKTIYDLFYLQNENENLEHSFHESLSCFDESIFPDPTQCNRRLEVFIWVNKNIIRLIFLLYKKLSPLLQWNTAKGMLIN